eukprot:Selendium_serpulae@DN6065_c1_g1_i1.p1
MALEVAARLMTALDGTDEKYEESVHRPFVHKDGTLDFLSFARRSSCHDCVGVMPITTISPFVGTNWYKFLKSEGSRSFKMDAATLIAIEGYKQKAFVCEPKEGDKSIIRYNCCCRPRHGFSFPKFQDINFVLAELLKCKCQIKNRFHGHREFIIFVKNAWNHYRPVNNRAIRLATFFCCQKCANRPLLYDIVVFSANFPPEHENILVIEVKLVTEIVTSYFLCGRCVR